MSTKQIDLYLVVSWLVSWTPDRAIRVRALAGDILLCFRERHLTLTAIYFVFLGYANNFFQYFSYPLPEK